MKKTQNLGEDQSSDSHQFRPHCPSRNDANEKKGTNHFKNRDLGVSINEWRPKKRGRYVSTPLFNTKSTHCRDVPLF